jgi:glycosyltransferase involved in cell wall biosynthesis
MVGKCHIKIMKIGYLMQEGVPDIRKKPLSGAANHVVFVIQELKKAGHQVFLLAKLDEKIYLSEDLENFKPVEVIFLEKGLLKFIERVIRRIQHEFGLPYANFFESLRFVFACRQVLPDCDIYFERMGWLGYGGGLAAQWLNIPLIVEVNGDHLDEFISQGLVIRQGQQRLSYSLMKKAALRVSHVVATGEGWRQKYIERWKVEPSKVSVIENGSTVVDLLQRENLNTFSPTESDGPMRIVYCGGFEAWHGISVLVYAVCRAINQGCNLHVTLIGSGAEQNNIRKLIKELDLDGSFTFTGHLNLQDTARYLAQAHIGISPYCGRVEFSGLKLLDYKAAGLATIASGKGKQPEVIAHGRTGWIVPPCDDGALSDAIVHLSKNPQLTKEMGQRARLEAERLHRWRNTAEELEILFKSILAERNRLVK